MTEKELARLAGVSPSTVSKAFSDAKDVSESTKEKIFKIAREYGCFGKYHKGKYTKRVIAIICPELISGHYGMLTDTLRTILEKNGCIAVISSFDFNFRKQAELIEYYASYLKVDGIFVFHMYNAPKKGYEIPIIGLYSDGNDGIDEISLDFRTPIKEAIDRLYGLGHRSFAFLGEELTQPKAQYFRAALEDYGDVSSYVFTSKHRFEQAGEDGVEALMKDFPKVTALVCAYDYIAIGAIKELQNRGLKIPEDVSVLGTDNLSIGRYTELSSIDATPREVCLTAWDLMEKKLENKFFKSLQKIVIKGSVIFRRSVSEAKNRQ